MSSSSDKVSLSSSSSERSGGSRSSQSGTSDRERPGNVGRIPMERIVEVREDPLELAESSWPTKAGYEWVMAVINTMEVIVCEGYGRHSASVVGMGYVVDGLEVAEMFLSG